MAKRLGRRLRRIPEPSELSRILDALPRRTVLVVGLLAVANLVLMGVVEPRVREHLRREDVARARTIATLAAEVADVRSLARAGRFPRSEAELWPEPEHGCRSGSGFKICNEQRARTLDVTGSARTRIVADLALGRIRVAGEGRTLEEAYQRLAPTTEAVRAFLAERGFGTDAITLGAIDTTEHHRTDEKGRETREVVAYRLARQFELSSPDPARVARAAGEVTELLKTGAHVESVSPRFVFTKLADLKIRMIGEATANARERAERIARREPMPDRLRPRCAGRGLPGGSCLAAGLALPPTTSAFSVSGGTRGTP